MKAEMREGTQPAPRSAVCRLALGGSSGCAPEDAKSALEFLFRRVRTPERPLTSREWPYVYLGSQVLFEQASHRPLRPS